MKTLKILNGDIDVFIKSLSMSLSFERSRARNQFIKEVLFPVSTKIEEKRMEICTKLCKKDADGKPVMNQVNNTFEFAEGDMDKAQVEYQKERNEYTSI